MSNLDQINKVIDLAPSESNLDTLELSNDLYIRLYNKFDYGYYRGYKVIANLAYAKETIVFLKHPYIFFNKKDSVDIYEWIK